MRAAGARVLVGREHLAPKAGAHHAHGEEEVSARADPSRAVGREPAAGHDGVHVRVKQKLARPGVEHHRDAEVGPKALRVARECQERLGRAREEDVEDGLARTLRDSAQFRRGGVKTTWK